MYKVAVIGSILNILLAGDAFSFSIAKTSFSSTIPIRLSFSQHRSQGSYWNSMLSHMVDITSSPLNWSGNEWGTVATVVGIAGFLYGQDEDIANGFQTIKTHNSDVLSKYVEPMGNKKTLVPAMAAMYLGGLISQNQQLQKTTLTCMESFLITNLATAILKRSTGRLRPYREMGAEEWTGVNNQGHRQSFPSGHTAYAFSIATVLATEFNETPIIPLISYGAATLVGLSRMNNNVHWSSDVLCGAALGYFIGKTVTRFNRDRNFNFLSILPRFTTSTAGLEFTYSF